MLPHRSIALFLLGLVTASAQDPNQAPPGVPIPGVIPPAPAGVPDQAPAIALGDTKITEPIEELKLNGDALAGLYTKYTGRRVIVSTAASTGEFRFVQDASPNNPLTYAEAAELLKTAATIENFIFVPHEKNKNLDILTLATGNNPKGIGLGVYTKDGAVYNENDKLPEGDAVISYVMTLDYIKPAEAVSTFTAIIGQIGAFGSIAPVPNASAIVITENTSLIRKLIDLKSEIDKPGSVQGTRFIKVQYADVTEIAETLTTLLTAQQSAQSTAGIQRAEVAQPQINPATGLPGQAAAGGGGGGEAPPIQIIPDPRTNRIFAMGRPVDLIFVEGLVREFDVETSEKNFLRRKLRFLTVSEFLPIAGDALSRAFSGNAEGGSGGGGGATQGGAPGGAAAGGSSRTQSNNRQSSSRSNGSTGANFGGSTGGSSGFGGSSGGGGGGGTGLGDPTVNSAPESVLVGRTLLVADNITNSIVVQGPPSGLEIIERLLDQIDVKPDQVMISSVIGQLTLGKDVQTGVDYLLDGTDGVLGGGGGIGSILAPAVTTPPAVPTGAFPQFNRGSVAGSGLRAIGTIGDLGVYLRALQTRTDFTVLSRPSIFTSNNQKGTISSGERIAIPTGSNSFGGGVNGNVSTQIEYQDVVLKLEVIPLVNSDNEITMQIALLNDEQNGTQTIQGGAGGQDLTVPRISTREILTTATVPNNNTIVLGGLIISRDGTERSGIPILGDIPYLGRLFSSTVDTKNRSELMVFIQPSIVKNDRSLQNVQADMDSRHTVSGPARTFADGPGVLPPVDAITPVADKSGNTPKAKVVSQPQAAPAKKKQLSFGNPFRK